MARLHYWQYLVDSKGNPLNEAQVRVYLAGSNNEANIYTDNSFSIITTSSEENLKTNRYGFFEFWIGDEWEINGGYESTQLFRIVWQNDIDGIEEEIDDILIFTPLLPVDITDSIKGIPNNKDKNKVISNKIGYKWDSHVGSIIPSASPHDLEAVVFFDLDDRQNKLISDKLGYQMYQMANAASSISVDISAARFYKESISSWSTSGGLYYTDITHSLANYYPIVKIIKSSNDMEIQPKRIKAIDINSVRIWLIENVNIDVMLFG